ncbi:phospho-N-acetylmuramoyl-pentapeptide-transferase [Persicirhabdus sediminis]|uniref:Phospho-N-acetylmuramoyl-pentapeptide-transferase n=1 Tax=Persicirhabdus sediminis TaxID=454144 RepID=A0A8J7MAZ5_9BACT|nr:phospho-N-acetylmuramoyl-pentapeptide-transferase [Persicirhabdus sediminis]MBK1789792.1 phospho-N-acetylmuramoyl-pentapeptide-transferase [Persicirhabdus sediminis]
MLYSIYQFWQEAHAAGADWAEDTRLFFNLLQYITVRAALACLLTFGLTLMFGDKVIRKLVSLKVGQPIRSAEEVHKLNELHGGKAGTPTMGGVMILGTVLLAVLICGRPLNPFVAVTMFVMLTHGLLGFIDDYTKVSQKSSDGISSRQKLFWQLMISIAAGVFLYTKSETSSFSLVKEQISISAITIPLAKTAIIDLGWFCIPFFAFIIVGTSNAVNLTDGLDGLAIGVTITVSLAYALIAYLTHHYWLANTYLNIPQNELVGELSVFLMALVGAGFGFLWFNCHPAKVFMGDTGSLAIGGALGTAAICTMQEFLLVLIGWVFVMEAMSVILQVASFKLTGKRIFAMSPIHHHFELRGWHENQVIIRFWIISIICGLMGLALLKIV